MHIGLMVPLLLLTCVVAEARLEPDADSLVRATMLADTTAIEPGKPFRVGVLLKIEPGWHTYWREAGDSGLPTEIHWKLPEGFIAGDLQWPAHRRIDLPGGLINYGYEEKVMLFATITPPSQIKLNEVEIGADVSWMVCNENQCLLGNASLSHSLPSGSAAAANMEEFEYWSNRVPKEPTTQPAH